MTRRSARRRVRCLRGRRRRIAARVAHLYVNRKEASARTVAALATGVAQPRQLRGVAGFAERYALRQIRLALYLQWLADRGLGAAAIDASASGLAFGFFRDLAVGAAPDGGEVWANPSAFARGVSIGAPPDPFSAAGQDWNLRPHSGSATGVRRFRFSRAARRQHAARRRASDRSCGRIVEAVLDPRWRHRSRRCVRRISAWHALLGLLARESACARCLVIGEDLGTVPEGLREQLAAADVLSTAFFGSSATAWPSCHLRAIRRKAATCVSTHDLADHRRLVERRRHR